MRILPLLIVFVVSLAGAAPVSAQGEQEPPSPPQDTPSDSERNAAQETNPFLSVFDADGLPMLHVSAPTYLYLGARPKLRQDLGGNGGVGNEGGGGGDDQGDGDGGAGDTPPIPPGDDRQVPEPATMLMLVPAALLAIRNARRKSSRS